jgi:hypothetical protein
MDTQGARRPLQARSTANKKETEEKKKTVKQLFCDAKKRVLRIIV